MRTVLKHGLGRSGFDREPRVILPPSPLSAVRRYRQEPPGRRPLLVRVLGWAAAGVVMLAVGAVGGAYLFFHQAVVAISAHTPGMKAAARRLSIPLPQHAAIALLLGDNQRAGIERAAGGRSDTIMLIRADPQAKTISLLSLPRDLQVPVYCPGSSTPRATTRIDYAYAWCGPTGSLETVEKLTGLPINYLITVNFHGFKEIVNDLGGIWLDVDRRYYNKNVGTIATDYSNIDLQPGYQRLSGGSALEFVRFRHTDNDFFRQARQQQFMSALKSQAARNFDPLTLPAIVATLTRNVEIAACRSCLSDLTVLRYALFAATLPPGHILQGYITQVTEVNVGGAAELQAPASAIEQAINQFVSPDPEAARAANAATLGKPKPLPAPSPKDTPVTVLNGNGIAGSAATAAYLLHERGYPIVDPAGGAPANAPSFNYSQSVVYYPPGRPRLRTAAGKLADILAPAQTSVLPRSVRLAHAAELAVIVGKTFHGTLAATPLPESQPTTPEPAQVSNDPQATLPLLEPLRSRAGFQLELPTVIESGSTPDPAMPVRPYTIQGNQKAVRLVFRHGLDYWGIEETAWTGAPILSGRNFHHTIAGRQYDLYYNGPHLHMAVLHQDGASYWVINSLQDALSNQTMLAIAKGLEPLRR